MKPGHHQRSSYGSESSFVPRLLPRIPVSSQFLLEFLHAVYFAMYVMYAFCEFNSVLICDQKYLLLHILITKYIDFGEHNITVN